MTIKLLPMTCKVLILIDKKKVDKVGMIHMPDETAKLLKTYARGTVVAIGDTAFNYAPKSKSVCKVGDVVYIIKDAGVVITENAGYTTRPQDEVDSYRVVNDEDILVVEVKDE